jgi:hypothetical protein
VTRPARLAAALGSGLAALAVAAPNAFALHAERDKTFSTGQRLHVYLNDTLAKSCGSTNLVKFNSGHAFAHKVAGGGTNTKRVTMINTFDWDTSRVDTSFGFSLPLGGSGGTGSIDVSFSRNVSETSAKSTVRPSAGTAHPGSVDWYYDGISGHAADSTIFEVFRTVHGDWEVNNTAYTVEATTFNTDVC